MGTDVADKYDIRDFAATPAEILEALWLGFSQAETGNEPDPWIRTKIRHQEGKNPNTAFGPAQVKIGRAHV